MKTRKRKPFSIYPKPSDMATAAAIAEEMDVHLYQVFTLAFRAWAKRREIRRKRRDTRGDSRIRGREPAMI